MNFKMFFAVIACCYVVFSLNTQAMNEHEKVTKCRYFNGKIGSCRYGDKCKFSHVKETPDEYRARKEKEKKEKEERQKQSILGKPAKSLELPSDESIDSLKITLKEAKVDEEPKIKLGKKVASPSDGGLKITLKEAKVDEEPKIKLGKKVTPPSDGGLKITIKEVKVDEEPKIKLIKKVASYIPYLSSSHILSISSDPSPSSYRSSSPSSYKTGDKIGENAYYVDSNTWIYYTPNGGVRVVNGREID